MPIPRFILVLSMPAARRALSLVLLIVLTTPLWAQVSKLTADDATIGDEFGNVVAFDGDYLIVGALLDDPAGDQSGSAYLFVLIDGVWTEQAKLIPDDAEIRDRFATSVALSGAYAVVGARSDDDGGDDAGAAYVFVRQGQTWTQQAKLIASDAGEGDSFGRAVALDGDYLLVSAPGNDEQGERTGAVYVFKRDGETWTQQAKLTASDAGVLDGFGSAVALEGALAAIGASGDDFPTGSVYLFERDGETWIERDNVSSGDGTFDDFFGDTVALSGDYILVGVRRDDDDGESSGSAYVFMRDGDTWEQQDKLTASDAAAGDEFGTSVALSGDRAVVGAPGNDDDGEDSGAAYVFERDGETWTEQSKLTATDARADAEFGNAVALSGGSALIAAFMDDDRAGRAGAAYVYVLVPPGVGIERVE
ncbi:MAG: FG-GAP repeat protein, partial [Rhodothermales bacterium]